MKLKGKIGRFNAPFIDSIFICEDLGIEESIEFLIDTGASRTTITDSDAIRLRINYQRLNKLEQGLTGIGGDVETYSIRKVNLLFKINSEYFIEDIDEILVTKHTQNLEKVKWIPSILGRDFLNKYVVIIDAQQGKVVLTDER